MPNDSFFERVLDGFTYAELLDVAERLQSRLQEFERDGSVSRTASYERTASPHPASPDTLQGRTEARKHELARIDSHTEILGILETVADGVVTYDPDGTIRSFSRSAEHLTGFQRDELVGTNLTRLMTDAGWDRFQRDSALDHRDGLVSSSRAYETVLRRKDGSEVPIEIKVNKFEFEGKQKHVCTLSDITEKKHREKELREEQARLRGILQNMPTMMNAFDGEMKCVMWNRECELVTGYSAEEMIGKQAIEIVVPDSTYRERMMREWQTKGDHRDWMWRFRTKNGEERCIAWSNISRGFPIPGWARWGVGVDVTDQVTAQEELRMQGDRQRTVIDSLHEGLIIADAAGNIVDVNAATIRMFGYDREELIGANLAIILPEEITWEHEGRLAGYSKTSKTNLIGKGRRLVGRHNSGREFPLHLHVAKFEQEGKKYFVGSTQDLTEKEQLESHRRQSDKLAAVGRLAGGIAHDFNNLLLPIITLTEIMLDDPASEEKRIERHKVVLAAAERGRKIVEKFLAFSREDSLITEAVDLPAMVEEVLGLVRGTAPATIIFQSSALPVPPVTANSGELHEVVVNLVINALDAIEGAGGEIVIEIDRVSSNDAHTPVLLDGRSYVRLSVSDNGGGMDDEVKDRMFDPFFTTKDVGVGSGLGLSVVHGIVERMQGFIDVSSTPGEGTIMKLYLPAMTTQ